MNDGTRSVGICLNGREKGSEMFLDQKETLLFCCLHILHKMWEGCGLRTVEEVTPWRDLTLVQQGYRGDGGSTMFWTQIYFCPPVSPPLQDSEGLVSCSGCPPGGTRSHHPDRRAPRRTHALGLPHLFGLHRPLSNLAGDERRVFFFFNAPLICVCWELNTCSHIFVVLEWISDVGSGWSCKTFPELISHVEITFFVKAFGFNYCFMKLFQKISIKIQNASFLKLHYSLQTA